MVSNFRSADTAERDEEVIDPDPEPENDHHHADPGGDDPGEDQTEDGYLADQPENIVDGQRADQFEQTEQNQDRGNDDDREKPADDHPQEYLKQDKQRKPHGYRDFAAERTTAGLSGQCSDLQT